MFFGLAVALRAFSLHFDNPFPSNLEGNRWYWTKARSTTGDRNITWSPFWSLHFFLSNMWNHKKYIILYSIHPTSPLVDPGSRAIAPWPSSSCQAWTRNTTKKIFVTCIRAHNISMAAWVTPSSFLFRHLTTFTPTVSRHLTKQNGKT